MTAQKAESQRRETAAPTISNAISAVPPTDPVFTQQWHLDNPGAGLLDLNVLTAWNDYTGEGVRVFVLDDGFDYLHTDLAPNYNGTIDLDLEGGDNDAAPVFGQDNHGTACMGIIGAARNGTGAVGIAYDAELVGIRGYSDDASATGTLDDYVNNLGVGILHAANQGGDVISMSNGYASGTNYFNNNLDVFVIADTIVDIISATATGRGGLGLNIVKAAGNSRADGWDTNMSAIDNLAQIISVAAVNQDGFVSEYSSFGAAILVSGFGSPISGEVVTTDRTGAAGYTGNDINTSFNGTSAATPMVSGVIALMLDANAGLGWRDVQDILASSARVVGSGLFGGAPTGSELYNWNANGAERWNGGGMYFSNDYGFGLVDATAAVRLAETWFLGGQTAHTSANLDMTSSDMLNGALAIPDNNFSGATVSGAFGGGSTFQIEYTTITITMGTTLFPNENHTFMGDLDIFITSSSGVISILHDNTGDAVDFPDTWTFTTRAFRGEYATGTWSVGFVDSAAQDTGTLVDVVVTHHGDAADVDDVHIFTDQYSIFSAEAGRGFVDDTNGGTDTINAAAVTTAAIIHLGGAVSQIDDVLLSISTAFENAIGGDGNDTITGNSSANVLRGMRGTDQINGGSGTDTLDGGAGGDNLWGGVGADSHIGGNDAGIDYARYDDLNYGNLTIRLDTPASNTGAAAGDTYNGIEGLVGGVGNDSVYGNGLANFLFGSSGVDQVYGGAGNDYLDGGTGADNLWGGAGADAHIGGNDAGVDYARYDDANHGNLTIRLDGGANAGAAAVGDTYTGIEGLVGGAGNDVVVGNGSNNFLFGSGGADLVYGGVGNDYLDGGTGADNLWGGAGADSHIGGNDAGVDYARYDDANHGNLTISLLSPASNTGAAAGDTYTGIEGLVGGAGNDVVIGNTAANFLFGSGGADFIDGLGGNDYLAGGAGADRFRMSTALGAGNVDTIADFTHLVDDILLAQAVFAGIGPSLAASEFRIGMALDADDRILYNPGTGQLFYDSNANVAGGMVHFATVTANTTLTFDDFIMV